MIGPGYELCFPRWCPPVQPRTASTTSSTSTRSAWWVSTPRFPARHGGRLEPEQLVWLDDQLAREPERPTLIFQHHPPFVTGIDWLDRVGLENGPEEAEVVARHPQVELLTSGHIHRAVHSRFGGTVASCWPSTCFQIALALDGTPYGCVDEPAGVVLHHWEADDGVASHFSYVDAADPWSPHWAEQAT